MTITASLGLGDDSDISSAEPEKMRAGERLLGKALEVLSDLGSEYLVGVLYGVLKKYPGPATAAGRVSSQEVLGRVSERAASLGITLALEVVNRYEANLFNTARGATVVDETLSRSLAVWRNLWEDSDDLPRLHVHPQQAARRGDHQSALTGDRHDDRALREGNRTPMSEDNPQTWLSSGPNQPRSRPPVDGVRS